MEVDADSQRSTQETDLLNRSTKRYKESKEDDGMEKGSTMGERGNRPSPERPSQNAQGDSAI